MKHNTTQQIIKRICKAPRIISASRKNFKKRNGADKIAFCLL